MVTAIWVSALVLTLGLAIYFFGWEKVSTILLLVWSTVWAWVKGVFNWDTMIRVALCSAITAVFLAGLLTTHKIGDALPFSSEMPKALADLDLSAYVNFVFWGKVARVNGFVLVVSLLSLVWTHLRQGKAPQAPEEKGPQ